MDTRTATTTTITMLRRGAGTHHPVLSILEPGAQLIILGEKGDWLQVRVSENEGFVAGQLVLLAEHQVRDGFLVATLHTAPYSSPAASAEIDQPVDEGPALSMPLEPSAFLKIPTGSPTDRTQRLVAATWNRYGGLLGMVAVELRFDPGVVVAVLGVEAGGRGFSADGRMIIRFEVHIFFDHWGKRNPSSFNQHFRFNSTQRWKGHQWRSAESQPWRDFHDRQATEWEVFEFARTLDDKAAKLSISMGGPQIMGFNHASIGYETVQQMFDAFSRDERNQIIGFFDFVKGPSGSSRKVLALQARDFQTFAELYNGIGKGSIYADKMQSLFDVFQRMWEPISIRRVNTAALNLRRTPEIRSDNIIREGMPQGMQLRLLAVEPVREEGRVWVKVRVDHQEGWVSGAFITPAVN